MVVSNRKLIGCTVCVMSLLLPTVLVGCGTDAGDDGEEPAEPQGEPSAQNVDYEALSNGAPLEAASTAPFETSDGALYLPGTVSEDATIPGDASGPGLSPQDLSGNPPTDDRIAVPRSTYGDGHPFALVGLLQTSWGSCTGFMVGSRVVMTAAHCVGGGGSWAGNVRFTPRYDPTSGSPWGTFTSTNKSYIPTAWDQCQTNNPGGNICQPFDKGWIVLDSSPNIGWFGVVSQPSSTNYVYLRTLGYPADKNPRYQYYAYTYDWNNPPAADWSWRELYGDWANIFCGLDFMGGQSGSPIFPANSPYQDWWVTAVGTASAGYPGSDPNNLWPTLLARIDSGDIQVINSLRSQYP